MDLFLFWQNSQEVSRVTQHASCDSEENNFQSQESLEIQEVMDWEEKTRNGWTIIIVRCSQRWIQSHDHEIR